MSDQPTHQSSFDSARLDSARPRRDTLDAAVFEEALIAQLACPACYGELRLEGTRLRCIACSRGYPIVDGIPVMIVERARLAGEES